MKNSNIFKVILIAILFITACSNEEEVILTQSDVLVINEGNFLSAEGSISGINMMTKTEELGLFEKANGFTIGATVQRMASYNFYYYLTTNNPDKLEVVDKFTLELKGSINSGLANPFSFAATGITGFVSNWGTFNNTTFEYEDSFISIVDLREFTISNSIPWDYQPQDLLVVNNKLYVTNVNSDNISVVNTTTYEIIETIVTPYGPDKMEVDANGDIWVICNSGYLIKIDPSTNEVVTTIADVSTSGFNEKMTLNATRDKIYFLSTVYDADFNSTTTVFELPITATQAPTDAIVTGTSFYGIGIDANNILYVGDHNNFQGNGTVFMYNLEGSEIANFESGIAPNGFVFR